MQAKKKEESPTQLSPKVLELKQKIQDTNYFNYAIDRIAVVMSRYIVEDREKKF